MLDRGDDQVLDDLPVDLVEGVGVLVAVVEGALGAGHRRRGVARGAQEADLDTVDGGQRRPR